MRARFRSRADAPEGGDAAAGPVPSTATGRYKVRNKESPKSEQLPLTKIKDISKASPNAKARPSPSKSKSRNKDSSVSEECMKIRDASMAKDLYNTKVLPQVMETAPTPEISKFEKFVLNAEHKVKLAVRLGKVLKDAAGAFRDTAQAVGATVLGISMFLYHKDRLVENYHRLKGLFPGSASLPAAPEAASRNPSSPTAAASKSSLAPPSED